MVPLEFLQVFQGGDRSDLVNWQTAHGQHPLGVQSLLSRKTILRVNAEALLDEVLSFLADALPPLRERVIAKSDLLQDLIFAASVERRVARQQDVGNDTDRPDIALLVVALFQDFRSDVVRSSDFFGHRCVSLGVVLDGLVEVDDFKLVEPLDVFKEDVLRFEVPVADAVQVAVVNTGQHLLDNDGRVSLSELSTLLHLFEQFTTLAKLVNHVVALLIFKEFVHANDVRVILQKIR